MGLGGLFFYFFIFLFFYFFLRIDVVKVCGANSRSVPPPIKLTVLISSYYQQPTRLDLVLLKDSL